MDSQNVTQNKHVTRPDPDQNIADRIQNYADLIDQAQSDPEMTARLAKRGYDTARLAEGQELHEVAQTAFEAYQAVLRAQDEAKYQFDRSLAAARQAFLDYRAAARPLVKDGAWRFNLAIDGIVPEDPLMFLTLVRSGYQVAFHSSAYLSVLRKCEEPAALLEAGYASLEALTLADQAHETAKAVTINALIECELALAQLSAWMRRFQRAMRAASKA